MQIDQKVHNPHPTQHTSEQPAEVGALLPPKRLKSAIKGHGQHGKRNPPAIRQMCCYRSQNTHQIPKQNSGTAGTNKEIACLYRKKIFWDHSDKST